MIKTKRSTKTIFNIILSILGLIWISPLFFVILNIFKSKQEYNMGTFWTLPEGVNIADNFRIVMESGLFESFGASLLYSLLGAVFAVCFGSYLFTAVRFFRFRFILFRYIKGFQR